MAAYFSISTPASRHGQLHLFWRPPYSIVSLICTNDTFEVVTAWCQNYFSKMGWSFGAVWPRSLHPRGLHMTCHPATATIERTSERAEIARSMHRHLFRSPIRGSVWKKSSCLRGCHEFRPGTSVISEPGVRFGCHAYRRLTEKWEGLSLLLYFDRLSHQM